MQFKFTFAAALLSASSLAKDDIVVEDIVMYSDIVVDDITGVKYVPEPRYAYCKLVPNPAYPTTYPYGLM